jgi:adenylate kinase family enzyme
MKIAVIGYSGSGKSTLAKKLGNIYNIPVLHLDKIQFEANWKERYIETSKKMVREFLEENHNWVIDGNYTNLLRDQRLEEADLIIYMCFSRWTCFRQAFKRYLENKGKTRECMADGCNEKFDYEFIKWILLDGRSKDKKKQYADTVSKYNEKVTILSNSKDTKLFCKELWVKIN